MRGFYAYHPTVQVLYYILAVAFAMFSMHPVILLSSLAGAFWFFCMLYGIRKMLSELLFTVSFFFLMAVLNPLFIHDGETILFFMNDNPVTYEAVLYGGMAALMIVGILTWCRCYSRILTTDKWLYLFGRITPKAGLLLAMAFRYIPLFQKQMHNIFQSQKSMGLYAQDRIADRIRGGIRVFDSLIAWSIENSIDTADAMKARGYGLPGRTNFSLFRFQKKDAILLGILGVWSLVILQGIRNGIFTISYYPFVETAVSGSTGIFYDLTVILFFCIPGFIEMKEKLSWKYLKSKI